MVEKRDTRRYRVQRWAAPRAWSALTLVVLMLAGGLLADGSVGAVPALAQDDTEGESVPCALTTTAEVSQDSSPGSPVANASPAAGELADTATTAEITLLVRTLASCLSEGDNRAIASLVSQRYLGALYGGGGELARSDFLELAAQLPVIPMSVVSVSDVRVQDSRSATADVVTIYGNQLDHGRWNFILRPRVDLTDTRSDAETETGAATPGAEEPDQRWLVNGIQPLPVSAPADARDIEVVLDEYSFTVSPGTATDSTVVLTGDNRGEEVHEILVLRVDAGVSSDALIRNPGPGLPSGMEYVGQQTIAPGAEAQLVLVDLEPGNYLLVCLFPDSEGTPHVALGMRGQLRIEAD